MATKIVHVEGLPSVKLLGMMGIFDGLSKAEYNERPMLITKIEHDRQRLIVESGVDANHMPTFASLPLSKMKEARYSHTGNARLTVGAKVAANLTAALQAGGLDVRNLACVKYHQHPRVPMRGYDQQQALADATNCTVVCGYYIYGDVPKANDIGLFSCEKTPMLKDRDGNFIDVLPDIGTECGLGPMTLRLFIEDPYLTDLAMNGVCSSLLSALTVAASVFETECFPFSNKAVFGRSIKEDHAHMVETRRTEKVKVNALYMDRRTFVSLATRCTFKRFGHAICTHFSLDVWPIVGAIRECQCCGIFTHLDVATCNECQAAHYCSKLCLKHHAKAHKKECKRPDWKVAQKAAEKARKARLAAYEANAKAKAEVEKAKETARKQAAQKERDRKLAAGDKPYTQPSESHR